MLGPHEFLPFTYQDWDFAANGVTRWFWDVAFTDDFGPVTKGTHFDAAMVDYWHAGVTLENKVDTGPDEYWVKVHELRFRGVYDGLYDDDDEEEEEEEETS